MKPLARSCVTVSHDPANVPVILQFGGQTAINLASPLTERGVPGSRLQRRHHRPGEDRERFEAFLNRIGIRNLPARRPQHWMLRLMWQTNSAIRCWCDRPTSSADGRWRSSTRRTISLATWQQTSTSRAATDLIDRHLEGKEVEVDAICDGTDVLIPGIMEHIERAGVHSGDSYAVYPGVNLFPSEVERLVEYTTKIALELGVIGLVNIQYVIHAGRLYVLEVNPRGSRTVPFLSKATGVPIIELATRAMLGISLSEQGYSGGLWPRQPLVAVKAPVSRWPKRGVGVIGPR